MARFTDLPVIIYFVIAGGCFTLINLVVSCQEVAWQVEMDEYDRAWDACHAALETPPTPTSLEMQSNPLRDEGMGSGPGSGTGAGKGGMNLTAMIANANQAVAEDPRFKPRVPRAAHALRADGAGVPQAKPISNTETKKPSTLWFT